MSSQPQPKFAVGQTVYHDGVKVLINSRMFVDGQWYYLLANGDITAVESSLTAQTIDEPQPQKSLGQIAYEARYDGSSTHVWNRSGYRKEWEAAAQAVKQAITDDYFAAHDAQVAKHIERINELENALTAEQNANAELRQFNIELREQRDTLAKNDVQELGHIVGYTKCHTRKNGGGFIKDGLPKFLERYRLDRIEQLQKQVVEMTNYYETALKEIDRLTKLHETDAKSYSAQMRAAAERERELIEANESKYRHIGDLEREIDKLKRQRDTAACVERPAVNADNPLGQVAHDAYCKAAKIERDWNEASDHKEWVAVANALLDHIEAWGPLQPKQSLSGKLIESTYQADFGVYYPAGLPARQLQIVKQCLSLMTTLVRKNADYGDSAFKSPALMPSLSAVDAVAVRMSDKIARIANLSSSQRSSGPAVSDESLIDSYLDLAGYSILQVINLREATPHRINGQHSAAAYKQALVDKGTVCGGDPIQSKEQYEAVWGPGSYDAMRGFIPPPPRDEGAVQRGY